ncbi:MAG TPA: FecR domain-containing protein [Puia sp.]|nr:FecR domain-containing protein [Puia sp.]
MQNLYHSVEDLLKDESFSSYCRGGNEQDIQYWQNYLVQNPGKRELIEEAVRQYRLLFNTIADLDLREQLDQLQRKIELNEAAPVYSMNDRPSSINDRSARRGIGFYRWKIMTAAAILLVIAGWYLFRPKQAPLPGKTEARYASKPGEKKIFQLPDGTQVTMNAGSEITLNKTYGQDTREVFLRGEAFFDVHQNKNSPFIVHTADMDIRALGTAFNVRSYLGDKMAETALIRGLVEITLKKENNKKILLHPNEKISWKQDAETEEEKPASPTPAIKQVAAPEQVIIVPVKKMEDGTAQELAWANNSLVFDDEGFDEIGPRLERWYGVKIIFGSDSEDVKRYHFTATFKKEKIERVLDILKTTKEFNYEFDGDRTILIHK